MAGAQSVHAARLNNVTCLESAHEASANRPHCASRRGCSRERTTLPRQLILRAHILSLDLSADRRRRRCQMTASHQRLRRLATRRNWGACRAGHLAQRRWFVEYGTVCAPRRRRTREGALGPATHGAQAGTAGVRAGSQSGTRTVRRLCHLRHARRLMRGPARRHHHGRA